MPTRAVLVLAVLVVATGLGLWWRARNGRYRAIPAGVARAAAALEAAGGAARPDAPAGADASAAGSSDRVTAAEIGAPLGAELTFLQLSSEVCAPCRRARAVLSELAAERPGLAHVEVDVEDHLELVRRFGVMRTPTVLLLDRDGVAVGRLSGAMDRRHALVALESCLSGLSAR